MFYAKSVMIVEHEEEKLVFGGEVTELGEKFVTVQSESMTVVFNRDDDTKINGDLTEGDSVTVTYDGNLSENPYALGIVVIQENKEKEKKTIRGTVSEVSEKSLVISVDSAHAARFIINKETKIDGDDKKVKVGDKVKLEYTGDVMKNPVAVSIKIQRDKNKKYFIMDGVVAGASKDKIVVQTSKKKYTFKIVGETRIENKNYMKAGHKTTITYMGELDKNPVAASIFCSKDTVTEQEKKTAAKKSTKKEKTKKAACWRTRFPRWLKWTWWSKRPLWSVAKAGTAAWWALPPGAWRKNTAIPPWPWPRKAKCAWAAPAAPGISISIRR